MGPFSKVVVLFAVLAVLGAGLFFFPQSPYNYKKIILIQTEPVEEVIVEENSDASEEEIIIEE